MLRQATSSSLHTSRLSSRGHSSKNQTSRNLSKFFALHTCLTMFFLVWSATSLPMSQATPIFKPDGPLGHSLPLLNPPSPKTKNVTVQSAAQKILASKPSWHDPCGLKHQKDLHHRNAPFLQQIQKPDDNDLMHGIVNMAKMALRQSRFFKEDYVSLLTFYIFFVSGGPKRLVNTWHSYQILASIFADQEMSGSSAM